MEHLELVSQGSSDTEGGDAESRPVSDSAD